MAPILYPRERQVLEFISQYTQRNGYAPTLREIGDALGMSSVATVHEHLDHLRKKGFIKKLDGAARGIELIETPNRQAGKQGAVELPVLGYIAAGRPLEPFTDPNYYMSVAPGMVSSDKPAYILQVKGTSMIDE